MQTEIERIAANLVRNEVHLCLSHVVATLANSQGVIEHSAAARGNDAAVTLASLCDQAAELCAPLDDWEEAARYEGWRPQGGSETALMREAEDGEDADDTAGPDDADAGHRYVIAASAREACEYDDIEPYQREIFEHWAVSQRLAEDLASLGERVDADFAGLCVWGRTTTGQMIEMDSVIQRVAQLVHDRAKAITEEVA